MMKKRISIPVFLLSLLFCIAATFQITYVYTVTRAKIDARGELAYSAQKLDYVDAMYRDNFVGTLDSEQLTDTLIRAYLIGAGEKYGSYLTAAEREEYLSNLEGNLVGIGVSVVYSTERELVEIVSITADSPAQNAGLLPGDLILTVDGRDAAELGYYGTLDAVRGEEGSAVSICVVRPSEQMKEYRFDLTREKITEQTVYAHMFADSDIGIIKITLFNTATVEQFDTALTTLTEQGAGKLIFDLRNNPGGELNSITAILDKILPEGEIIIATDKDGKHEVLATSDAAELDLPMAVLINGSSASAAELFAASIRDYQKGPLIGLTTYGKGTMQTLMPLPDGSAISISNRMFTSKAGVNYEGVGIVPDLEVAPDEAIANKNPFLVTDEEDNVVLTAVGYLNGEISIN